MTPGSRGSKSRTKRKTGTGKATRKKTSRRATKKKVARKVTKKKVARKVTKKKVARKVTKKKRPAAKRLMPLRAGEAERIQDLEATIRSLQTSLASIRGERESALRDLDAAERRIAELEAAADTSRADTALQSAESSSLLQGGAPAEMDMLADMDAGGTLIDDEDSFEDAVAVPQAGAVDLDYDDFDDSETFLNPSEGISERRRELDRERADRELELGEEDYWFVCPKCGEHLIEHEFDNIKVERCESCGVVTMDKGEIELLLAADDEHMISYRVKGLLQ